MSKVRVGIRVSVRIRVSLVFTNTVVIGLPDIMSVTTYTWHICAYIIHSHHVSKHLYVDIS